MITLQFLITSLIIVLIPGTGVIFTISTGIMQGRRASLFASIGCTAGIVPHLLATTLGLAAVMHTSAVAFQILKFSGVAYLFYLALVTWTDKTAFTIDDSSSENSSISIMVRAFFLNILNPKLTIFFLAFLPQFIKPADASSLLQMFILSSVFMVMTFVVFVIYGFLAHSFRKVVIESSRVQKWLRCSFAAAFIGLGGNLALSDR